MDFRPSFKKGSILKQYMLEYLRDYPETYIELLYSNMGNGIITGLDISVVKEDIFCVGPGIVKSKGKIYIFQGETELKFDTEKRYVYLRIQEEEQTEGTKYNLEIIQLEQEDKELLEIFRYTKNAEIKKYTDINELLGEYRPINRIDTSYSKQSIEGGNTVRKEYFILYGKKILENAKATSKDVAFAYECMNGIFNIEILRAYFETSQLDNETIFRLMKKRLNDLGTNKKIEKPKNKRKEERKMIIS